MRSVVIGCGVSSRPGGTRSIGRQRCRSRRTNPVPHLGPLTRTGYHRPIADLGKTLERVILLYNTDYDAELIAASPADVSAVQEAARAVCEAVAEAGYKSELIGIEGPDLDRAFTRLRDDPPDLVFNPVSYTHLTLPTILRV